MTQPPINAIDPSMTLTKQYIVDKLNSSLNEHPKKEYFGIIETLLEIMKRTLESGEDILVSGFGKFQVREKKQRKGRNPTTGEVMMLPARKVVTFKCSEKLREMVNSRYL